MSWLKRPHERKPVNWKSNLVAVWISQFISLSSFYFCLPFLPLYLKEKQIVPAGETAFWSGVFIAAAPVSMMIMSPIWGMLGDRYGRKMMLVRSNLAGAFVLYLMAVVPNIEGLIVLRLLQGAFTGTVPSAQSLVAAATPNRHQGFALGLMMAAINAGYTAGAYFGGLFAKHYGAAATFKFAGVLLLFATATVFLMVREDFTPSPRLAAATRSARLRHRRAGVAQLKSGVPALLAIAFVALLQTYDGPFLALYVEDLFHTAAGIPMAEDVSGEVYGVTGSINALASIIAVGGSISISYILDRNLSRWVWVPLTAACAAGLWIICGFDSIAGLTLGRTVFLFFASGLASVLVVIQSRMTPSDKRGSAMGWTVTARCIGWMIAPLAGAAIVSRSGYYGAYWWLGLVSLLLIPFFLWLTARYPEAFRRPEADEEAEVMDEVVLPPQSFPITPQQTTTSGRFGAEE